MPIPASIVPTSVLEAFVEDATRAKLSPRKRGIPPPMAEEDIWKGVVSVKAVPTG